MNRERVLPVLLAVVCVVALAFVAASVVDPTSGSGGGSTVSDPTDDDDPASGEEGTSPRDPLTAPGQFVLNLGVCLPFLLTGEFYALALLAVLGLWSVLQYRDDAFLATAVVVAVGFPALFVWLFLTSCGGTELPDSASFIPSEPAPDARGGNASVGVASDPGTLVTEPPVVLLLLGATLVVGLVGYVIRSNADEGADEQPDHAGDGDDAPPARARAIGDVAGEVADRLERDAGVENEVFRAWVEMTDRLDVAHPRSSTPSEFAAAAVDAGVSRDDVAEVTELFEEVRYGGEPPTDDRVRRAVAALRHIEDEYGEDGADGGTG